MKFTFLLPAVILLLFSCKNRQIVQEQKPNIIFVMTDDHAKKAMSLYSKDLIQTPNLDRIGKEGITFENAFVTNSLCGPSRAVFLTGKYSHINGFRANFDRFDGSQPTLPKYLKDGGYYTAIVGKWHLVSEPQGFDSYEIMIDQGEYYTPRFYNGKDTVHVNGYATDIITDKAIALLEKQKNAGKPIFLMLHQKAPHRDWMPNVTDLNGEKYYPLPETFYDDYKDRSKAAEMADMRIEDMFLGYDLKLYLKKSSDETNSGGDKRSTKNAYNWLQNEYNAMTETQKEMWDKYYKPISDAYYNNTPIGDSLVRWKYNRFMNDYLKTVKSVDDNMGRLLKYLDDSGLAKNTMIIYTSDQGFFLGEHGWFDKRFMYEPSLSMPLVMRFPGKIKKNTKTEKLVQNLDLAPTIMKAAGLAVPQEMQGKSLDVFFKGKNPDDWKKEVYYHFYEDNAWHTVEKHFGIRTERYKLIYFYDLKEWEMYDLLNDPHEVNNLYGKEQYQTLSQNLKSELKKLILNYKDSTAVSF